jgi:hypothetical protein
VWKKKRKRKNLKKQQFPSLSLLFVDIERKENK